MRPTGTHISKIREMRATQGLTYEIQMWAIPLPAASF
jgi:hypothetical protein